MIIRPRHPDYALDAPLRQNLIAALAASKTAHMLGINKHRKRFPDYECELKTRTVAARGHFRYRTSSDSHHSHSTLHTQVSLIFVAGIGQMYKNNFVRKRVIVRVV